MSARDRVLLDTSVEVHLCRGKETGEIIDKAYGLRQRTDRPLVSVITVGETLAFAMRRGWGSGKVELLRELLAELVIVDINDRAILERFAEIRVADQKGGWNVGDNDTWIAATASVTDAILLTIDQDFARIDPRFLRAVCIST
jgi:tRNA(fMet)-specific endonuclease VapC